MNEMNGDCSDVALDALINEVVRRRAADSAAIAPTVSERSPQEALVHALGGLNEIDWPADEVGDRIALHVAAAAGQPPLGNGARVAGVPGLTRSARSLLRSGRSRWLAAGAVAAATILVTGAVALIGGSPGTARHDAGPNTIKPTSTPPPSPASTHVTQTPASLTAMAIVSHPGTLRHVGVVGSNSDFLSCASRSVCYLAGFKTKDRADIVRSENGGVTWKAGAVLPAFGINDLAEWDAILSCPSALTCFSGYGNGMIETRDGFAHYRFQPVTSPDNQVVEVSCPTTRHCVAVIRGQYGETFSYTDDGGTTWAAASAPAIRGHGASIGQLTCARRGHASPWCSGVTSPTPLWPR